VNQYPCILWNKKENNNSSFQNVSYDLVIQLFYDADPIGDTKNIFNIRMMTDNAVVPQFHHISTFFDCNPQ